MPEFLEPLEYPKKPSLQYINRNFGPSPGKPIDALQHLGRPHVESFNFMLGEGMELALADLKPLEFEVPETGARLALWIADASISNPAVAAGKVSTRTQKVYPTEFRQRGGSYKGRLTIRCGYSINGVSRPSLERVLGNIPIMLRSNACNLAGLSPAELVAKGEQEQEWGGFFIIGGHERLIRMLQTTRKNYPITMKRSSWKSRGKNFSDLGVLLECGKRDLTITKNVVHYVTTGTVRFMFSLNKQLYFVPVLMILKALKDVSDSEIFRELMVGAGSDPYRRGMVVNMLRELQEEGLFNRDQAREFIGRSFRAKVSYQVPAWYTNKQVCDWLLDRSVAIHLDDNSDKFSIICVMIKKLFAFVQNKCVAEGVDSLMNHELVLGGHLYLQLLKEKFDDWLNTLKLLILRRSKTDGASFQLTPEVMNALMSKTGNIEKPFENFLGTGNLPSRTGLGLMQSSGMTIMAENINRMRYMSHFRAIHRGSFFQEMRTTEVRALLPDAWGFVCPVHTPDGSPCGLLNHLAMAVEVCTHTCDVSAVPALLVQAGMLPIHSLHTAAASVEEATMTTSTAQAVNLENHLDVVMDGKLLGWAAPDKIRTIAEKLRAMKVDPSDSRVPSMTEIALIPERDVPGQYPGLFIFSGAARIMRPVWNLSANCVEYIGTLEQVYMEVCTRQTEAVPMLTTHKEIRLTNFLSNLACTIPLPDFNQSPRNMYQCQMGKQTMASPIHTWHLSSETKMYRLQTPTSPFFRPAHYDYIGLDDYPMGTNAIVAVISYTGYDMEDAMIINKMSFERGFCAGMIYKSEFVDLREAAGLRKNSLTESCGLIFARDPSKPHLADFLGEDGLPHIGMPLKEGDPLYCFFNQNEIKFVVKKYTSKEAVIIDSVKLCSNDAGTSFKNRVCISYRLPRNPSVGDKFASRAGQKGICSQKWPCEDIPWTTSGLFPDIIFNPHGFPSRMTIAMMIENMAGKSGAIHGRVHDATPFTFSEDKDNDAITYFAQQLEDAGYNYYGTETMYSGMKGVEMTADIFFGVIHYQRLRHMVSDKFQVRSTGPIDALTQQPVKGRRRGGGVRFGEMERDSLLSHGTSYLLQDRILHGSDKTRVYLCRKCGNILSPLVQATKSTIDRDMSEPICALCGKSKYVESLQVPYIFVHLVKELISVNIKVKIGGAIE